VDGGAARTQRKDRLGHLRARAVVLVGGQGNGAENADDRYHDHQLYQGESVWQAVHAISRNKL
jgi:hypothetical protein